MNLDAEVEAEEAQVTHLEDGLHLCLECLHLVFLSAGDHQITNVDANEKS